MSNPTVLIVTVFLVLCFCHGVSCALAHQDNPANDKLALLSFKSLLSDPNGALASWNQSNHQCNWHGITCGNRHPERVTALDLDSAGLAGRISPSLGNLSFLRRLHLPNNKLEGQIPQEVGRLSRLQILNLQNNSLSGEIPQSIGSLYSLQTLSLALNSLSGKIQPFIGNLSSLVVLELSRNNLSGGIPPTVANLSSLKYINLVYNALTGEIPFFLGDLFSLTWINLEHNNFFGTIPDSLGHLPSLTVLYLSFNNLSGTIPPSIWNVSSLIDFEAGSNQLSGKLPTNIGETLPNLERLLLYDNMLYGPLPPSLANVTRLSDFELSNNTFSGLIPQEIGTLKNLIFLYLDQNFLEAKKLHDWDFVSALTNNTNFVCLELQENRLSGVLPVAIANLSSSMLLLSLGQNKISGTIPVAIQNLVNLNTLHLAYNTLSGTLPSSLGMMQNLQELFLSDNNFIGEIPSTLGNLTKMSRLAIAMTSLSGKIPESLGNLRQLEALDLSSNLLTGPIPKKIVSIPTLSLYLGLSNNQLTGSVPSEVGNLTNLIEFHSENNQLSGEIPSSFDQCKQLQFLYLQRNFFQGGIPSSFSELKSLEKLDLSSNNLSGNIPIFLEDLSGLSYLNLSFNNFTGKVPNAGVFTNISEISIRGNKDLCGGIQDLHLPSCSSKNTRGRHKFPVYVVIIPIVAFILCLTILSYLFVMRVWPKSTKNSPTKTSVKGHMAISYYELARATNGFSTSNLIGVGSFGYVYKGILTVEGDDSDMVVAIKVLNLQNPIAFKSFTTECEAMRNLRHRNLVKIITSCSSIDSRGNDFRAIVFEFMPNGSLEEWLHPREENQIESKSFSLLQRLKIAIDVASALDYLHRHSDKITVHCDLKASNILLDADMVAHVGDFGIARFSTRGSLSSQASSSTIGLKGTVGYAAPEYGAGNRASAHGDIYSYGVLVLEMITGKRPTDEMFRDSLNLHNYVEQTFPSRVLDIVDERLLLEIESEQSALKECIVSMLSVGLQCSKEQPMERLSTNDIIKELLTVRDMFLSLTQ